MMEFENTLEVECATPKVFEFVADFENLPKWNYYVMKVTQTSGDREGEGAAYHQIRKNDQQDFTVVEYDRNQRVTVQSTAESKPQFKRTLRFIPDGSRTKLVDSWQLDLGNPLVNRLGKSKVKAAVAENLAKLKQLLETGHTRLQDGRAVTL